MLPTRQTIIAPELEAAYSYEMGVVESSHGKATKAIGEYWMALWRIKSRNLWRAKYEANGYMDWIGDITKESFGPSRTDFFATMGAIERLQRLGLSEDEIQVKLGHLGSALKDDLRALFSGNGKGGLLPEVLKQIEDGGETPAQFVDRVSNLAPGEARREVRRLVEDDTIYPTSDWEYDNRSGRLLVNVIWENKNDGLVWKGTVTVSAVELTEPRKFKDKASYLPEMIANYFADRLNLKRD